jgi:hypothetical protein
VELRELNALICQTVNIGRVDLTSKNANVAIARIVQHDEQDVRALAGIRS